MHRIWPSIVRMIQYDRRMQLAWPRYKSLNQYSFSSINERWGDRLSRTCFAEDQWRVQCQYMDSVQVTTTRPKKIDYKCKCVTQSSKAVWIDKGWTYCTMAGSFSGLFGSWCIMVGPFSGPFGSSFTVVGSFGSSSGVTSWRTTGLMRRSYTSSLLRPLNLQTAMYALIN